MGSEKWACQVDGVRKGDDEVAQIHGDFPFHTIYFTRTGSEGKDFLFNLTKGFVFSYKFFIMTEKNELPTLFLVDGSNYLFRAFYALPDLSNSKGFPTNAIYGFTTMLLKLMREYHPTHMVVVFDLKAPTFRHEAYDLYKAHRKATPDALLLQIPYVKEIVRALSIPVIEREGIEADDIIGTLAKRYAKEGMRVLIVSGDKDMMQLIDERISMVDTMKDKRYDVDAVKERFGVAPEKVPEILGLMGDNSDNIPGIPGVGPKVALRLIEEFGTVEGVIENVEKIKNVRLREAVRAAREQAKLSRALAEIRTDIEIDFPSDHARLGTVDRESLIKLFKEFEFHSLIEELGLKETRIGGDYRMVEKGEKFRAFLEELKSYKAFALFPLFQGENALAATLLGLALAVKEGEALYIPFTQDTSSLQEQEVLSALQPLFRDPDRRKYFHDLKASLLYFAQKGIEVEGTFDTMVSSYVLDPGRKSMDLPGLARDHLKRDLPAVKDLVPGGNRPFSLAEIPREKVADYACAQADAIFRLAGIFKEKMKSGGFEHLFYEIEMPLVYVLAQMERRGVLLDLSLFRQMSREMEGWLKESEERIYRLAGERFNINSPKQLQMILFEKLGLPRGKKTKEGYSTDMEVLASLAQIHELPAEILAYRTLAKLKSTYVDALPLLVNPHTGRVHTSYNQTVTATGRLSSSNPNLQNIPIRTPEGRRIRQAFIAPGGWKLVSADYSQIELRILAHLARDEFLIEAFSKGEDIHVRTAADIFGVAPGRVNGEMRRKAKVINFGIIYGMSAYGLAKELSLSQQEAQKYIDDYFRKFKGVKAYIESILEQARRDGYVQTLFHRRRYLPEISSPVASVRQFAERTAINTPIQGTAADLIKMAMVNIVRRLRKGGFAAAMIMQVHDELVFEVPEEELSAVMALVKEEMEGVISLNVPLHVEMGWGNNWDEAHG